MSIRKSTSLQNTISYIREYLRKSKEKKLPSVRSIARECQVSLVTVSRAMALLKKEGLICSVWGSGYFVSGSANHKTASTPKVPKWKHVLNCIKSDIFNGKFQFNHPLPAINQIAVIYDVSIPTVYKVISALLSENIIRKSATKYYLCTKNSSPRQKIAIVAFGLTANAVKIETERERNFYRMLTNAAVQQNLDLEIVCYNDYIDPTVFFVPDGYTIYSYLKQEMFCGIILSSYHMNNSANCLRQIIGTGKPVSIWIEDEHILQSMIQYSSNSNGVTFFDSSYSTMPGNDVAQYLLEKKHHQIAYISPFHHSPWSQHRLLGLKEAYSSPDLSLAVHPFVLNDFANDYAFMAQIIEHSSFQKNIAIENISSRIPDFMANQISSVEYEYNILLRNGLIFAHCQPLLDKATAITSITAWVCANDLIACMIMDYWDYHNIPITKRPALMGFDNTFGSFERGISTYEFNTSGEVQSMITHLLYPNSSTFTGKRRTVRLKGKIIERASTLKPATPAD